MESLPSSVGSSQATTAPWDDSKENHLESFKETLNELAVVMTAMKEQVDEKYGYMILQELDDLLMKLMGLYMKEWV